ncbi:hypothetical protein [Paraburkholderia sp. MM6662-R1]|uniref:hypothetical protein n=1 Tax=Paraburkholderia sp. MM6662-R1 TaxID=2991066 RepID=UPI003D1D3982
MIALTDLIAAQSDETYEELRKQFREERAIAKTDADVLTDELRKCTDPSGHPLLRADEYADLAAGHQRVRKLN